MDRGAGTRVAAAGMPHLRLTPAASFRMAGAAFDQVETAPARRRAWPRRPSEREAGVVSSGARAAGLRGHRSRRDRQPSPSAAVAIDRSDWLENDGVNVGMNRDSVEATTPLR